MSLTPNDRLPQWRLPPGVAPGTWEYTRRESIATQYASFLEGTPLVSLDVEMTLAALPTAKEDHTSRVVDFGCGDGRAMRLLWERGYDVLGIDMSMPMLRRVTEGDHGKMLRHRVLRANLVQLEGLGDAIADHGICLFSTIGMIRGQKHRRTFLRHAYRMLRPGGMFVLHVHNRNDAWRDRPSAMAYLKSAWGTITSREHELGDRTYSYRGLSDMFLHTYSRRELLADLKNAGWAVEDVVPLTPKSDGVLPRRDWLPSVRAGGFIALCRRRDNGIH